MKFHCATSSDESTRVAIDAVIADLRSALDAVDVVFVFFTAQHCPQAPMILQRLRRELDPTTLIGCSGEGVIGGSVEIERQPGIAVLAGQLDGVDIHPIHIATDDWQSILSDPDELHQRLGCREATRAIIGFGDPWTTPLNQLMQALDEHVPHAPLIGGMASAAQAPGQNVLLCDDDAFDEGFVGLSLSGNLRVQTLVSQGARPTGEPMVVTKAHDNVIEQLGGKSVESTLTQIVQEMPEKDRALIREHGLLIGRAMSEYRDKFARGDFLVRNIMGMQQGGLVISDHVRVGQTVQLHVRDAESADEDLRILLETASKTGAFDAGLLFSCNGRGTRMFEGPNHDISATNEFLKQTPIAGFFAAGEIGPVGGRNFIHGQTASFALLRRGEPGL